MRAKQTFGELALLYRMERSATIKGTEAGLLWKMERSGFLRCMEQVSVQSTTKAMTFFHSEPTFHCLSEADKKLLASHCSVQIFKDGYAILRKAIPAHGMYIVVNGK